MFGSQEMLLGKTLTLSNRFGEKIIVTWRPDPNVVSELRQVLTPPMISMTIGWIFMKILPKCSPCIVLSKNGQKFLSPTLLGPMGPEISEGARNF